MTATTEKIGTLGGFTSLLDDTYLFQTMKKKNYPQFVTKTIRLLGNNSGLKLIFAKSAEHACFNPKTKVVKIPPPPGFPNDTTTKSMEEFKHELDRWRGILNHEVGHAMFTLWQSEKIKEINPEKKLYPYKHHMFNDLFENGRMERVACDHFPGMLRDFQKLEGFLGEVIKKMHDTNPANFNHIYYALRMVVNGYEPAVNIPDNLREDWDIVREMAKKAWNTNNEEETYKIARNVEEYLKARYEEEKEKKKEAEKKEKELKEELEKLKEELEDLENDEEGEPEEGASEESEEGKSESEESEEGEDEGYGSCKMPWEEEDEKEEEKGSGKGDDENEEDDDMESDTDKSSGDSEENSEEDTDDEKENEDDKLSIIKRIMEDFN